MTPRQIAASPRLDGYEPRSRAARTSAGLSPPTTWSRTTPPASAGECRHGISDPAWCGVCTPPSAAAHSAKRASKGGPR